jgi:chemotaxis methyl-accepting protein methylase
MPGRWSRRRLVRTLGRLEGWSVGQRRRGRPRYTAVKEIAAPNIEVRQTDLVSDELPCEEFDFVHTRLVLMHIPAREQVLGELCAVLRPGGVLMVEEQRRLLCPRDCKRRLQRCDAGVPPGLPSCGSR